MVDGEGQVRMRRHSNIGFPHVAFDQGHVRAFISTNSVFGRVVEYAIVEFR